MFKSWKFLLLLNCKPGSGNIKWPHINKFINLFIGKQHLQQRQKPIRLLLWLTISITIYHPSDSSAYPIFRKMGGKPKDKSNKGPLKNRSKQCFQLWFACNNLKIIHTNDNMNINAFIWWYTRVQLNLFIQQFSSGTNFEYLKCECGECIPSFMHYCYYYYYGNCCCCHHQKCYVSCGASVLFVILEHNFHQHLITMQNIN